MKLHGGTDDLVNGPLPVEYHGHVRFRRSHGRNGLFLRFHGEIPVTDPTGAKNARRRSKHSKPRGETDALIDGPLRVELRGHFGSADHMDEPAFRFELIGETPITDLTGA